MSLALASRRAAISPAWVKNPLWRTARAVPSLDLQLADTKSLADAVTGQSLVTFTRASSGTYVGSDGVLRTAAVNEPRFDHNPTTGESLGLLVEEQRTNLATSSATFQPSSGGNPASYTVDQIAPDGTTTASRQTAANPRTFVDYGGIANAQYTFSVYAKAASGTVTIALQLKNAASDTVIATGSNVTLTTAWQRLTVTGTTNGATTGARIEVIGPSVGAPAGTVFWGAQLEAGAFPTSYIPTTTATATRSADVASITGTAFSSWYRQDEGTVYSDSRITSGSPRVWDINDGGDNNRHNLRFLASQYQCLVVAGGASQAAVYDQTGLSQTTARNGYAYQANSFAIRTNGGGLADTNAIDTSGAVPVVDRLFIGQAWNGGFANGTIRRLVYWGQRLPNNVLQAITQ